MSKEEKAKEYSKECALCPTLDGQDEIDLSSQLTACKEALREIIKQISLCNFNMSTSTSYSEAIKLDRMIDKVKTLIE